jgi:hypothetical protein
LARVVLIGSKGERKLEFAGGLFGHRTPFTVGPSAGLPPLWDVSRAEPS